MEMTAVTAGDVTFKAYVLRAVCTCCLANRALPNLLLVYCLFAQNYLLGIIVSICGNVLISISLNIQVRDVKLLLYEGKSAHRNA